MRAFLASAGVATGGLLVSLVVPGCTVGYVVRSAYFQLELLASREPVARVRASEHLSAQQEAALDVISDVKAYGNRIGLSSTDNYETMAIDWHRTLLNLTACDPLSFEPRTWWFPVVGRMPYLGFFRALDARRWQRRLAARGFDVYLRPVGAYSTLGWFRDPVLPQMFEWDELDLAETVLHELAHATLWVKGNVAFNESFASFVGEIAALRYLADRHGEASQAYREAEAEMQDLERWRALQHALYMDLDAIYLDARLSDEEKRRLKAAMFARLPEHVDRAAFLRPERFRLAVAVGEWNNATLVQFRTYNANRDWFRAVLDRCGGDLLAFIDAVRQIARQDRDPFLALERAARRG